MSLCTAYPAGAPSWVAQLGPDPQATTDFYAAVLGWELHDIADAGDPPFFIATLRGDPVASIAGPVPEGTWIVAVTVDDLDEARRAAEASGGTAPGDSVDIATLGRFHRLHDPAGAEIHAVQPLPDRGPSRVVEVGAWSSSTLLMDDPDAVAPFYEAVFGWSTTGRDRDAGCGPPAGTTAEPGPRVAVVPRTGGPTGWLPGFRVDDVDGALDAVRAGGGTAVDATDAGTVVVGPDGARFILHG